ncbi:hypothetical protein OTERR_16380 [Oryzomicrobium terrae]|uniref:Lipoprotein n=1 Tax=Oryzomicrobium terrae TaxID=1735038 RepID=A0A5C1E8Z2_9RHOO|nr:hypothetical protein [Oryzomicrobium terrae]QEL65114.1 hypothetical protein OTERR_16380 [Oryzomicrobium terrae]
MKSPKLLLALAVLGLAATGSAWADRGHVHFGVSIGAWAPGPWYGPPRVYYPPAYYPPVYPYPYYPPVVVTPPSPPVYVEQAPTAAVPQSNVWYFCPEAKAYYPYVKECASGWQQVAPQPPAGQ